MKQLSRKFKVNTPVTFKDFEEFESDFTDFTVDEEQRSPRHSPRRNQMTCIIDAHQWEILDQEEVQQALEQYQARSAEEAIDLAYVKMYIANLKAEYLGAQFI